MKRILVIVKDKEVLATIESFLTEQGYDLIIAKDALSAIKVLSRTDVDLIFVDILLSEHIGTDILQKVRDRGLKCPVIIITEISHIKKATYCIRMGAFDFILKPTQEETLLRVTNIALHNKALIDEKDKIEAEKERYRSNLDAIFRSVKDAIITVDKTMRVIEINRPAENICDAVYKETVGKEFKTVFNGCTKACHSVLNETLKTKRSVDECRIECGHEARPHQVVVLNTSPLIDNQNRFMGAVLIIRDITRLVDMERELKGRHLFHNTVGKSKKMQEIYTLIEELANVETTVLITGESGTGKELVAGALHYGGIRSEKPFVKVNCSALSEDLLESELFGHVKGAFTGAIKDKIGRFQKANGGTILLDEIGDISSRMQLRLLRVLQEKEFERVGDSTPLKIDVRIIASTNRNLKEKVRLVEFREDLYFRLKVIEISIPPLRERREDIPLLTDHFRNIFNKRFKKEIIRISDDVLRIFIGYSWPGNVRELEHAIEHAFIICRSNIITIDDLPIEIRDHTKEGSALKNTDVNEIEMIREALEKTDWNKAKAARLLGMDRTTLYRKLRKYKLAREQI
ncbi:MAG: sigma 54-interacting transcriptional regulator [Thermodesulfobacteriota bacterium]|nr:sigma 54-interacting transcriptional regulator [Thermodesulfobacteriota bacterium]